MFFLCMLHTDFADTCSRTGAARGCRGSWKAKVYGLMRRNFLPKVYLPRALLAANLAQQRSKGTHSAGNSSDDHRPPAPFLPLAGGKSIDCGAAPHEAPARPPWSMYEFPFFLFLFLFLSASYFLFSREVCGLRLDSVLLDLDADSDWFSGPDVHMCLC